MSSFSLNLGATSTDETSSGFAARCQDIFGVLAQHVPKLQANQEPETDSTENEPTTLNTTGFRGKESIFRVKDSEGFSVPQAPFPRGHFTRGRTVRSRGRGNPRVPGHVVNPEKYTKYSLADVDITTEKGNTRAAFDFLRQREEEKKTREKAEDSKVDEKISFKKPIKRQREETNEKKPTAESFAAGGPSKRVLPECVVGAGFKSKKQKREIKLTLDEDGDDVVEDSPAPKNKSKSGSKLSFSYDDDDE